MNWQKFRLGFWSVFWGAIGGAIVLSVIGFKYGGWVTHGTAEAMADEAIVDRLAQICVAQFNEDAEKNRKFDDFKKLGSWEKENFVEKQGWATMPGKKKPNNDVADECAVQLTKITPVNSGS